MVRFIWLYQALGLSLWLFLNFQVTPSTSSPSSSSFSSSSSSLPITPKLCHHDESIALLQFKNSLSIDDGLYVKLSCYDLGITGYHKTESWKEGKDCCLWDGVTCDKLTGHVIGLDLGSSWLAGNIDHNSSIFLLKHLTSLNLAFNNFNGSQISPKIGQLTSLTYLSLSRCSFSAEIPSEIAHLSSLVLLDLSGNDGMKFSQHDFGKLSKNLTNLNALSLDLVNMSSVALPSFLNLTSSLKSLSLLGCELHGNFPDAIFLKPNLELLELSSNTAIEGGFLLPQTNWSTALRFLRLSVTGVSGNLPSSIGYLSSLNVLDLSSCQFTGSLPSSIGNLTRLTSLDLSWNSFTGELPLSLVNLKSLNILSLVLNNFGGGIPNIFSNFTKMTRLQLSLNSFTGELPSSLANLESLTELFVFANNLSGPIPDVFSNLQELTAFNLNENNFSGQIPSSVFSLKKLTHLDISQNQLVGPLPEQVSGLSILEDLDLSENLLDGAMPSWLFTLPSLLHLNLFENRLTGQIHEYKSGSSMNEMHPSRNNIHGPIPNSISGLVNITFINLSWNNLSGVLNIDMISKLKYLHALDLSGNSLSSIRSKDVIEWSMDTLNVSHNLLSRVNLPRLTDIRILDLSSNFIEGSLPFLFRTENLFLSSNKFTGEIPSSMCNHTNLEILDLSNNSLSGRLPRCLGCFSRTLSVLNLGMNSFHGHIPTNFSRDNSLRNLDLSNNQFQGPLPLSLTHCQRLEVVDLANNRIDDSFPFWLESLSELQVLVLRSNRFHGPIANPMSKKPFGKLRILDLSNNAFDGTLPTRYLENMKAMMNAADEENVTTMYMGEGLYQDSVMVIVKGMEIELVRILTIFSTIDLSSNKFEGNIPEILGNFHSLKLLNLSHNFLSGHIPSSFGNMAALESLDLCFNKLVGEIPSQLTALNFLSKLNLSQNSLEGQIPRGQQFDTFDNDSYIGNVDLCGLPLSRNCSNEKLPGLPQSTLHAKDKSEGGFNWKIAAIMGYGCGLVLGCSMAYIVFSTGKPWWFVKRVEGEWQYKVISLTTGRRRRKNL